MEHPPDRALSGREPHQGVVRSTNVNNSHLRSPTFPSTPRLTCSFLCITLPPHTTSPIFPLSKQTVFASSYEFLIWHLGRIGNPITIFSPSLSNLPLPGQTLRVASPV
jgi:hypothetical protein